MIYQIIKSYLTLRNKVSIQSSSKSKKSFIKKVPPITIPDSLSQLAFDNSLQANIIFTVPTGKIIMVNHAAGNLLGYSKKELLYKSIPDIFDIAGINFKKMVRQRTMSGKASAIVFASKKGGGTFPCEISSAVFTDNAGLENAVLTILDISKRLLEQSTIDDKKNKIVADNIILAKSKQKNIDTQKERIVADNIILAKSKQKKVDIKKDKIIAANIIVARSKQKNIDIQKEKLVAGNIVLAKSKQKKIDVEKEKVVAANIVIAKSKQKKIDIKKEKIVASNIVLARSRQKNIDTKKEKIVSDNIILAQAKSEKEKLAYQIEGRNKLLVEIEENFKLMFNSSSDVLFDSDLVTNKVMVNDAYEKEFGYLKTGKKTSSRDWATHIHPDDKKEVMKDYYRIIKSKKTEWKCAYRFLRADHSIANVLSSRVILRNAGGKAYRMIGSMQDVSKQRVLEERLEQEIKLKEKQIEEASEDAKDAERSDIGKELHDNVNQLLGVSKLYLDMAKRGGENSDMYLSRSSEYTLSAIEEIRKLTKSLTADTIRDMGLREAIENIARQTMEINPVKVAFELGSFIEKSVNDKFKLNVLRIVQEQLNNILKHARATKVSINLFQTKKTIRLTITDNGIGFDTGKKRKGIGVANIKSRAETYNGIANFISKPGKGCVLTATFSARDMTLTRA